MSPHILSGNSEARRFHSSSKVKQHLGLPAHLVVMYGTLNRKIVMNRSCSSYDPPLGDSPSEAAMQLDMMDAVPALAAVDVHPLADKQSD